MAARKRIWTPEIVRQRIRTSMLVSRLQRHVDGKLEMTATQVTAALGLLRKTAPDLARTELTGKDGAELGVGVLVPQQKDETWSPGPGPQPLNKLNS